MKMVCAGHVMVPMDVKPGDSIPVHASQSSASRAIRIADVAPMICPFSRGFSACLKGTTLAPTSAKLSLSAYEDLWMWRVILQLGFNDRSWMVVPIRVPLLLCHLPKEDAVHRMHRQGAQADDVLFVDACTEHGNGMGFVLTDVGWKSFSAP